MGTYEHEIKVLSRYMMDNEIRHLIIDERPIFSIVDICKHIGIRKFIPEEIHATEHSYPKIKTKMKFIDQDNLHKFIYLSIATKAKHIIEYVEKYSNNELMYLYTLEMNHVIRNLWNVKLIDDLLYLKHIRQEFRYVLTVDFKSISYEFITKASIILAISKAKNLFYHNPNELDQLRPYIKLLLKNDLRNSRTDVYHSCFTIDMNPIDMSRDEDDEIINCS